MKLPDRFYQMVSINIFKIANRKIFFLRSRILRSKIKDSAVPTKASARARMWSGGATAVRPRIGAWIDKSVDK